MHIKYKPSHASNTTAGMVQWRYEPHFKNSERNQRCCLQLSQNWVNGSNSFTETKQPSKPQWLYAALQWSHPRSEEQSCLNPISKIVRRSCKTSMNTDFYTFSNCVQWQWFFPTYSRAHAVQSLVPQSGEAQPIHICELLIMTSLPFTNKPVYLWNVPWIVLDFGAFCSFPVLFLTLSQLVWHILLPSCTE